MISPVDGGARSGWTYAPDRGLPSLGGGPARWELKVDFPGAGGRGELPGRRQPPGESVEGDWNPSGRA